MAQTTPLAQAQQAQTVSLENRTKLLKISKATIDSGKFRILDNRRRISTSTVRSLVQMLKQGKHFDAPLVVNYLSKDEVYEIIDGNHRWEAIQTYIKANPLSAVEVQMAVYDDLEGEAKKELYTKWNKGRKQTTSDVIQQYAEDIAILKHLMKPTFPTAITIYGQNGTLSVFKVLGGYMAAKNSTFQGGYIGTAFDFVDDVMRLKQSDANTIAQFIVDFQSAFGPMKNNRWARTTPFNALFRIWYDNKLNITPDKMQAVMKSRLALNGQMADLGNASGASACVMVRETYLQGLNANRRTDLFVKGPNETVAGSQPAFMPTGVSGAAE